jgi:hypothetical protein
VRGRVGWAALLALAGSLVAASAIEPAPVRSAAPALARADPRALVLRDPAVSAVNRALVRRGAAGAGVDRATALVGDLTGDGRAEMVVPVAGGGASGVVAYFVYAVVDGRVRDILPVNDTDRAVLAIDRGSLVEVTPAYGPRDARCCPSALRTSVLRWDGQQMTVESSRRRPAGG